MNWFKRRDDRLRAEMEEHIDFETQQNIDAGMSPTEARRRALEKFGNVTLAREESRDVWGLLWLDRLWQDLRYAIRGFFRNPGFTAVALISLVLGIGASTALFSVVYGVLISPYPYAKPDEIWAPAVVPLKEKVQGWHSYPRRELLEIQKLPAFSEVMATGFEQSMITSAGYPESMLGIQLTANAFHFIGVPPLLGRTIQPFDVHPGGEREPVVVLSYGFWQTHFNGDPNVLGKKLDLNNLPFTVIGVMPSRFGWFTNEAFWLPMPMDKLDQDFDVNVIMRLKAGVTPQAAEQQLQALNIQLAHAKPDHFPKTRSE